jgi:sulfonate dioxygenase
MAPALIETPQDTSAEKIYVKDKLEEGYKEAFAQGPKTTNYDNELKGVGKHPPARYPNYLPVWDNEKDIGGKYPPNQPFEAVEHGIDADPSFQHLLRGATSVEDLTANIGAEVKGIQLSKLDKAGKDELALFVAQKKVVGKHRFSNPYFQHSDTNRYNQLSAIKTLQTYQFKRL